MKAPRKPGKPLGNPSRFQFTHRHPENTLRVEQDPIAGVTIRAARDNFSLRDKTFFVNYLADEGFISQQYREFVAVHGEAWPGLEWVVVERYSRYHSETSGGTRRARSFMMRLLIGASLLWLTELTFLLLAS